MAKPEVNGAPALPSHGELGWDSVPGEQSGVGQTRNPCSFTCGPTNPTAQGPSPPSALPILRICRFGVGPGPAALLGACSPCLPFPRAVSSEHCGERPCCSARSPHLCPAHSRRGRERLLGVEGESQCPRPIAVLVGSSPCGAMGPVVLHAGSDPRLGRLR